MSTETLRPLSLLRFDFDELYARHLGRHSQFGINVAHLAALYGIWFGVYASVQQASLHLGVPAWPAVAAMAGGYLAVIALNAPLRVTLASALFLAIFATSVLALPQLPPWSIAGFLAMVPVFYKFQSYNHRIWTKAADMSEFNRRLPPGRDLTLILLMYEVPICLNYLLFHRGDWRR